MGGNNALHIGTDTVQEKRSGVEISLEAVNRRSSLLNGMQTKIGKGKRTKTCAVQWSSFQTGFSKMGGKQWL